MTRIWICCVAFALLTVTASAQPTCQIGTVSVTLTPLGHGTCTISQDSNGWYEVIITRSGDSYPDPIQVAVRGSSGAETLSVVYLEGNLPNPQWYSDSVLSVSGVNTVHTITSKVPCRLVELEIPGDLGNAEFPNADVIVVTRLISASIGGSVHGDISADGVDVLAGGVVDWPIDTLRVEGDFNGDLNVENGSIRNVLIEGRLRGRANSESGLSRVATAGGILNLQANSMNARIIAMPGQLFRGQIIGLQTRTGDFVGSIQAQDIGFPHSGPYTPTPAIDIAGNLDAQVVTDRLLDAWVRIGGEMTSSSRLCIKQSLRQLYDGSSIVRVEGQHGLRGQVIANALNLSGGVWQNGAAVAIGPPANPVLLTSPTYSNLSADLGGGAVGLVPYALHDADCVPPNSNNANGAGLVLIRSDQIMPPVILRHYGPIVEVPDSQPPVIIEVRSATEPEDTWKEVTPIFNVEVRPEGLPGGGRAIRITPMDGNTVPALGTFRVTPIAGRLVCDDEGGLLAAPDIDVAPWTYYFAIVPDCNNNGVPDPTEILAAGGQGYTVDCNNNGYLDYCDIAVFGYSTDTNGDGVPDDCTAPTCRADFDGSGFVTPADVSAFVTQWNSDLSSSTPPDPPTSFLSDFNLDHDITPADVALFVSVWAQNVINGC